MEHTFQIGTLASLSGHTPDTLRYYERVGLLPPPLRSSGGFRRYAAGTLERLTFIRQAKSLGLSLREIGDLLSSRERGGRRRCQRVRNLLSDKLGELDSKLAELGALQTTLVGYLHDCDQALGTCEEPECPVIDTLEVTPSQLEPGRSPRPRRSSPGAAG